MNKETIEILKKMVEDGNLSQEIAEKYCPELAESEDEMIRKEITEFFKNYRENGTWKRISDVTKWIAWLEKKSKQTSWKPSKEEMDALYGLAYITNKMDDKKDEAITKLYQDLKREFFNGSSYENMFSNTEDDVRRRSTIQILEYARSLDAYNQYGKADIDKNIAWLEKQGNLIDKIVKRAMNEKQRVLLTETNGDANIDWDTRSLQDVKLLLEYGLDYIKKLEKQGEQKPAWSEEDEKPLLEKFKQAVYDCAWGKVTCKKEGETQEEYAERWAEQFLLMVRDWADDYIDFTIQQKLRKSYEKGKTDIIEKQGKQNPTWSEEDEQYLLVCKNALAKYQTTDKWDAHIIFHWLENKLKSLRPQN